MLDILGKKITIEKKTLKDRGVYGLCFLTRIEIDDSLKGDDLKITVCHEIAHAVLLRLGFENTSLPHELEELIVDNIAKVLVENKMIKIPRNLFD